MDPREADAASEAYYIAFGAHGPRAQSPPGEGWKVAGYTFLGLAVSGVIFATIRAFAGPAPSTMNREWEEATNEYLKVRDAWCLGVGARGSGLLTCVCGIGSKLRADYGYLVRGIRWAGTGAERAKEEVEGVAVILTSGVCLNKRQNLISFVMEACWHRRWGVGIEDGWRSVMEKR